MARLENSSKIFGLKMAWLEPYLKIIGSKQLEPCKFLLVNTPNNRQPCHPEGKKLVIKSLLACAEVALFVNLLQKKRVKMEVNGGNPSINFTIRLFKGYNLFYYHIDVQRNREWTLIPISVMCMIPHMMLLLLIMQSIRQMLVQFLKTTRGFPLCDILLIFREIDINLFASNVPDTGCSV